ncbi:hypothetical protein H4Q26_011164 [Puccinia striiformis f. sp. tritici PST-130]|nr:hypothetical protein H4Q26_011164 [Puccinia striiformis f. sp. tritici PST-130]
MTHNLTANLPSPSIKRSDFGLQTLGESSCPSGKHEVSVYSVGARNKPRKLSVLSDEILLLIFSELSPSDLHHHQAVSRYFFAWCAGLDGLWKPGFISKNNERLSDWKGSWRSSYIWKFMTSFLINLAIKLPNKPAILKGLIDEWPAYSPSSDYRWTLDSLTGRYPNVEFRAESTLTTLLIIENTTIIVCWMKVQCTCLIVNFSKKTSTPTFQRGLGEDFVVPEIFQQDLFSCLGDQRPDTVGLSVFIPFLLPDAKG